MNKEKNQLSNGKLLAGAIAAPIMTYVFWQMSGFTMCSGILLFTTIAAWIVIYLRAKAMVQSIRLPARPSTDTPTQPTQPLTPPSARPDSRSIFL
jgi:hypothetical protein